LVKPVAAAVPKDYESFVSLPTVIRQNQS
jgi:hypothetical protein